MGRRETMEIKIWESNAEIVIGPVRTLSEPDDIVSDVSYNKITIKTKVRQKYPPCKVSDIAEL